MAERLQQKIKKIKMRRGKRTDIPALRTLLTPAASQDITKRETRYWRRLAADPSVDFYVAEYAGIIRGMVLVCYIRGLDYHGWYAVLDFVVSAAADEAEREEMSNDVGQALIDFAKTRAHKRDCQQMLVYRLDPDSLHKQELLTRQGFYPAGSLFSCTLS